MDATTMIDGDPTQQERTATPQGTSMMTLLGIVEGEVLTVLETGGATTLRGLVRALQWPAPVVMMAVGALIRQGLARGIQHELEVVIEPREADRCDPQ